MASKYEKLPSKVHTISYVIGVFFLVLIIASIVLIIPRKDDQLTNKVNNLYYASSDVQQGKYNPEYVLEKGHLFKEIDETGLKKLVENSKDSERKLIFVLTGVIEQDTTYKQFQTLSDEFERRINGYKDINDIVIANEELKKAAGSNLYFLNALPTTVEFEGKQVNYKNFSPLKDLGVKNPNSSPTILVFYNGEYLPIPNDYKYKPMVEPRDIRNEFVRFLNYILAETLQK